MKRYCGDIYKKARVAAGLTQEQAEEMLPISLRTLQAYEGGELKPSEDIVLVMCEAYNADWLAYAYLQSTNELGRKYLPKIDFSSLPSTVLRFQKEMADTSNITGDMIDVTCDGIVDRSEKEVWNGVTKEIKELVGAGLSVLFVQKEKTTVGAAAR